MTRAHRGHRARRLAPLLVLTALCPVLGGCQVGYVWKQAVGQLALSFRQVPITDESVARTLDPEGRRKLGWIPVVLAFSERGLGLEPGDGYRSFLDTEGRPVSHVVVASHRRALIPYRWCFPFVGCVPYKGHFDPEDAEREAEALRQEAGKGKNAEGLDVLVRPVAAYSTLGWFSDPVISTMLERDLPDLVDLLIHETVHRTLYVSDETTFNESLATHIAREGTRLFFERYPEAAAPEEVEEYLFGLERRALDEELIRRLRWDLEALYASDLSAEEILERKDEVFATARRARELLHGRPVERPASNADVVMSRDYHQLIPELGRLQRRRGGHPRDLMAYLMASLEKTGKLPEELRSR